jgi:putative ABC transport system permease protein
MTHGSTSTLLRLLWTRFSWRHATQAPLASALLVAILAIGVGVFLAIRLANQAAVSSFRNFTDLLTAESDGLILAPAGALPESILTDLRRALGAEPVNLVAVLESTGTSPREFEDEVIGARATFQLLGVDIVALRNLAAQRRVQATAATRENLVASNSIVSVTRRNDLWEILRDPHTVFISQSLAKAKGLTLDATLPLVINERIVPLRVRGILPTDPNQPEAPAEFLLMDLPALQAWTGRSGWVDRIEFVLEEGPRRKERWTAIRTQLESRANQSSDGSPRWRVSSSADRRAGAETMTRAFRLNLTILSMLALAVGLFLVFIALDGAVVRRREEIAILRALGVTPRQIQLAWLIEATALGLVGGLAGLALGWVGAQGAVRLVGRTVNALYYATSANAADLSWTEAAVSLVLAVAASICAGILPARTAALTPPAQVATRGGSSTYAGGRWLRRPWIGIGLILLGIVGAGLPPLRLEGGGRLSLAAYGSALCWAFGASILGGPVLSWLGRQGFRRETSVPLRLAFSQIREPSGRHRLAAAGLVCAIAMTAGMAILVGSFDTTMRSWIARTFQADLYISSDGAQSASTQNRIAPSTWKPIAELPQIARANAVQVAELQLSIGTTLLFGGDLEFFRTVTEPAWLEKPFSNAIFDPAQNQNLALVSESFCERFQKHRGDRLDIPTPSGVKSLVIAGSFSDYGNERGSILVDRAHFSAWFRDELASSLILQLKPGVNATQLRAELRQAHPGLAVYTNEHLRREALRIFRQTFSITYALELIGIFVAVAGLGFTLASLLWERRGDLTTLRALGLRRAELAAATAWEGILTATAGISVGLLASLALGWLLIERVNKQTFGWTLQTDLPWAQLALLALLVLVAAGVTGWIVGRWGSQLPAETEE